MGRTIKTALTLQRRGLLGAGLALACLPWRFAHAIAQSEGALRLVRLPKAALVIGNAEYRAVPTLANSTNDARAMAEQLAAAGFAVELRLDATRAQMIQSIEDHARRLAAAKGVGLFYFAGHGLQLAWHNYLLPVDAVVKAAEEIPTQGVDLGAVLDGARRAANAMNLVIVDACRDNPFGGRFALQKGLSQIDAPPATLLAYSTSPGNTASDGAGANGLYTENLLREMKVREAKIEDVFKRVRLGVRRQSRGQQIPWESTSLEEDFYFLPPDELKKRSREEEEKAFQEELALFRRADGAKASAPLVEYLRRHPSGRFAELAQMQLDRVLAAEGERRIEIAPAVGNPNTGGTVRADTLYKVGDTYAYRIEDRLKGESRDIRLRVTSITDSEVRINGGRIILDLLGNIVLTGDGRRFTPRQDQPLEFSVGKRWTTRFHATHKGQDRGITVLDFRIASRERITVPAGTFDCFRIEGVRDDEDHLRRPERIETRLTYWAAPDKVRRPIAQQEEGWAGRAGNMTQTVSERRELVSFRQS